MARKTTPKATNDVDPSPIKPIKFDSIDPDEVELVGRHRSSKFEALKAALDDADIGDSFITDAEGNDAKEQAQYRITLYSYMTRFGILTSCKPTKDGRILVTKRDPKTKRIVTRKKKAS